MSIAERIYDKAKELPASAQEEVLQIVETIAVRYRQGEPGTPPLRLRETAELRGKLAAWEEDWNAPGMEIYDRP
jgi:hypothetical protein